MGKSPGKWIKTLLLGKKSSKSTPSKGREVLKSSNEGEQTVSSAKLSVSDPTISSPLLVGSVACNEKGLENQVPSNSQSNEALRLCVKEHGSSSTQTVVCSVSSEETERLKLDQAATKAQAALRGYLARREFRFQKCIIMLQAQIRGHLVRRQAVSTFCCVKVIVKFQALVCGRKDTEVSNSLGGTKLRRPLKNAFVYKLRASLPTSIPLRLQYCSDEPNSASLWLKRWTKSRFWDPPSEPKKNLDSKSRRKNDSSRITEAEQDRPKRSTRRLSGSNAENGSIGSTLDSEKVKRNPKKVPSNTVNTLQEHSPNEIEKVKRGLRKSCDSTKAISDRSPVENGKPKQRTKKTSGSPAPAVSELGVNDSAEKSKDISELGDGDSAEKMNNIPEAIPKQSDPEKDTEHANIPVDELRCQSSLDFQPVETIGKSKDIKELSQVLICNEDCMTNDYQKPSERRASLPANFDPQENGVVQNTLKLPSYMAPTESAKAKLRAQGSPRFSRDAIEKNALLRRHSLSSSSNSMLSTLSPRVHKLVQATGRGGARGDRSFSSSRDGGDKLIQAEWRR